MNFSKIYFGLASITSLGLGKLVFFIYLFIYLFIYFYLFFFRPKSLIRPLWSLLAGRARPMKFRETVFLKTKNDTSHYLTFQNMVKKFIFGVSDYPR